MKLSEVYHILASFTDLRYYWTIYVLDYAWLYPHVLSETAFESSEFWFSTFLRQCQPSPMLAFPDVLWISWLALVSWLHCAKSAVIFNTHIEDNFQLTKANEIISDLKEDISRLSDELKKKRHPFGHCPGEDILIWCSPLWGPQPSSSSTSVITH